VKGRFSTVKTHENFARTTIRSSYLIDLNSMSNDPIINLDFPSSLCFLKFFPSLVTFYRKNPPFLGINVMLTNYGRKNGKTVFYSLSRRRDRHSERQNRRQWHIFDFRYPFSIVKKEKLSSLSKKSSLFPNYAPSLSMRTTNPF